VTDFAGTERALARPATHSGRSTSASTPPAAASRKRTLAKDGPHPLDEFRRVVDLNLIASFNVARLCAERMSQNEPDANGERGVILMTASIAAFEGQIGRSPTPRPRPASPA
jgi:NAD(P)-dependent dehydrogenase (short-subunit alcohol dehydrogenase family)